MINPKIVFSSGNDVTKSHDDLKKKKNENFGLKTNAKKRNVKKKREFRSDDGEEILWRCL